MTVSRPAAHRRGRAEPQCAPRYCLDGDCGWRRSEGSCRRIAGRPAKASLDCRSRSPNQLSLCSR